MKINVAKSAGFCFGVKRALKIARDIAKTGTEVDMLGDIVHNEDVVKDIESTGIKKIKRLRNGSNKTLLIRAHGASAEIYKRASEKGYSIVDATCPMVKEIHDIVKVSKQEGCKIVIIGDKDHDEVRGIMGQLNNRAIVIESLRNIPLNVITKIKKACVVVQSTQNVDKTLKIVDKLKEHIRELKFYNTICKPTRIKQKEAKNMPLVNDVMIIIGSRTSANTKRLYEISKFHNKKSYWIEASTEVNPKWFEGAKSVGVMAGASTPDSTTKQVITRIRSL
jgi:4-hydroxy-3-methylbut-2-enyl diphosphate reductase